jgi:hypothetical protein
MERQETDKLNQERKNREEEQTKKKGRKDHLRQEKERSPFRDTFALVLLFVVRAWKNTSCLLN